MWIGTTPASPRSWAIKCLGRSTSVHGESVHCRPLRHHSSRKAAHPTCWDDDKQLPCMTTPAPTDDGRPAPKSSRGKMDLRTHERWLANNRQFAPWRFQEEFLFMDQHPSGIHSRLRREEATQVAGELLACGHCQAAHVPAAYAGDSGRGSSQPKQTAHRFRLPGLVAVKHLWGDRPSVMGPADQNAET